MALLPLRHCDTFPVRSTSGVSYPWQVQPLTTTGAPPPFPGPAARDTVHIHAL